MGVRKLARLRVSSPILGVINVIRESTKPHRHSPAVVIKEVEAHVILAPGERKLIGGVEIAVDERGLLTLRWESVEFRELHFKSDSGFTWRHEIPHGARVYGFGLRGGLLNKRRWKTLRLWNRDPCFTYANPDTDPLYLSIPFYMIVGSRTRPIGVFIDCAYPMLVDPGTRGDYVEVRALGSEFCVFVIFGRDIKDVLEKYTALTGRPPLPPLWGLGIIQSRWSYTLEEAVRVVLTYRKLGIPLDAVFLDIDYMDKHKVFTWGRKYKRAKKYISLLHALGCKVIVNVDPYVKIDRRYKLFVECVARGYYVRDKRGGAFIGYAWSGTCIIPDVTREDVRRWWARFYVKFMQEYGVDGFCNDMNEPTFDTRVLKIGIKPDDAMFSAGEFKEVANIFALLENDAVFSELRKTGRRVFLMSRSGFAGIQRYGFVWTGDVWSTWIHLRRSVTMILGLSLSGVPLSGADIGGFNPPLLRVNPKLFIRWFQLGMFYPLARVHYTKNKLPQEPYMFGSRVVEICRRYARLRYHLLPYLYTLVWEAHVRGVPIVRPLFFEFPDDALAYEFEEEFMFGPWILVAPVLRQDDTVIYYLPRGYWLDVKRGQVVRSRGLIFREKIPLEDMPIFVRDGALIPSQEPVNHTGERVNKLLLHVFVRREESTWFVYEDDGITNAYERGEYNLIEVSARPRDDELIIKLTPKNLGFKTTVRTLVVRLHTCRVRRAELNGKSVDFNECEVFLPYPVSEVLKIKVATEHTDTMFFFA